jgi:hypothetical protein
MTEAEWEVSDDPERMLLFLTGGYRHEFPARRCEHFPSVRKLHLFAYACVLQIKSLIKYKSALKALEAAPQIADGELRQSEIKKLSRDTGELLDETVDMDDMDETDEMRALNEADDLVRSDSVRSAFRVITGATLRSKRWEADCLREIVGDPYRQYVWTANPSPQKASYREINNSDMRDLVLLRRSWLTEDALRIAKTAYDKRDFSLLPVLGDALEEAGCDFAPLLYHLRKDCSCHALGCWALDLVLEKR